MACVARTRGAVDRTGVSVLPAGRVVVLSPHLDDAVFSLGGTIAGAVRTGRRVDVVTVFAGDPRATAPAGEWDRAAGFASAGAAATTRRREDRAACRILGANPIWLPFSDEQYGPAESDDDVWSGVVPHLEGACTLLMPGFPLTQHDHRRVTDLALARAPDGLVLGCYVEQPYAVWRGSPGVPGPIRAVDPVAAWRTLPGARSDRIRKWRACLAYRSQVRLILRRSPGMAWRLPSYERAAGGEALALTSSTNRHR
jgi:LmbE family N-acetylglucosaminyl deacetylase